MIRTRSGEWRVDSPFVQRQWSIPRNDSTIRNANNSIGAKEVLHGKAKVKVDDFSYQV